VDNLKRSSYSEELNETLATLPDDLNEAYLNVFGRIFSPGAPRQDIALRILEFLTVSRRSLTVEEIDSLLAMRPRKRVSQKPSKMGRVQMKQTLLELFAPIVRILEPDGTVELVHLSIKDFLAKHEASPVNITQAHERFALSCLRYLNQPRFKIAGVAHNDIKPIMEANDLLVHAALSWSYHFTALAQPQEQLISAARVFLASQDILILWLKIFVSTKAESTGEAVTHDLLLLDSHLRRMGNHTMSVDSAMAQGAGFQGLFEFILERLTQERGPMDLHTLQWCAVLGKLNLDYTTCERHLRRAIEGFGAHPERGAEHPETITTMVALGRTYWNMKRLDEAEAVLRTCMDVREATMGPDDPDTLEVLSWLATVHRGKGMYDQACEEYEAIIKILQAKFGRQNRVVMREVKMLGVARRYEGNYDEAEALFQECLDWCQEVLGNMHPETVQAEKNLAMVYQMNGRLQEAEEKHRSVIVRQKAVTGEDAEYFISLQNLGETLRCLGRLEEAEKVLWEALTGKDIWHGPQHPHTKLTLASLARVYEARPGLGSDGKRTAVLLRSG
jgi:tetratricopeptide (TPR) repeat protein